MQNPTAILLFVFFGLILFLMYIAIRRRFASPIVIAGMGVVASVIVMTLIGLVQGNTFYQAIFAGILVGGLFSAGTLAMAAYFQSNEQRSSAPRDQG
jgi:Na+/H+-translocating membrane pyrophosphatase